MSYCAIFFNELLCKEVPDTKFGIFGKTGYIYVRGNIPQYYLRKSTFPNIVSGIFFSEHRLFFLAVLHPF
jgi:hypothetical protein